MPTSNNNLMRIISIQPQTKRGSTHLNLSWILTTQGVNYYS